MQNSNMPYTAGSLTIQLHDDKENIDFPTWILYPSVSTPELTKVGPYDMNICPNGNWAMGRLPLVVISHGGGGSHQAYRILAQHLARNGYFVAMPEHYGNNRNDNSLEGQNSNLTLRTRHVRLVIDNLLSDPEMKAYIDAGRIYVIGHSMGGCTALAVAGGVPRSMNREPIEVTHDDRVRALVLFAPAAAWYQHPDSLKNVSIPIVAYSAEHDSITPSWQSDLIKRNVGTPALVSTKTVENAGHLSFLSPFPEHMHAEDFPPSQDPAGFDRAAFHETLKEEILLFFNRNR